MGKWVRGSRAYHQYGHSVSENLIYGLIDPRNSTLFYVGQSSRGAFEPEHYVRTAHRGSTVRKMKRVLRALHNLGLKAEWTILEEVDSAELLDDAESFWISAITVTGAFLANMTPGGYAKGAKRSPDTGKKISLATKGIPRPHTTKPECRIKITCHFCGDMIERYVRPAHRISNRPNYFCSRSCTSKGKYLV